LSKGGQELKDYGKLQENGSTGKFIQFSSLQRLLGLLGLFYVRAKSKKIYCRNHGNKVLGLRIKKQFILKYA